MRLENVNKIFEILYQKNPTPKTELNYTNNFTLLVAVILSAQSTDVAVNKTTEKLFAKYTSPESFLELGIEGIKSYIKTIGLYNSKATNIIAMCQKLIKDFSSQVPNSFEKLISLPGVGAKTANVVLNCAFGEPVIAVDTHVFRVAKRLGLAKNKSPDLVGEELKKIIPQKWKQHAHHWLILHGRYICKAKKPNCLNCPINNFCETYKSLSQEIEVK